MVDYTFVEIFRKELIFKKNHLRKEGHTMNRQGRMWPILHQKDVEGKYFPSRNDHFQKIVKTSLPIDVLCQALLGNKKQKILNDGG
jgi:hypothetical protein